MNARTLPRFTLESYLAWEAEQPVRNEFYRGEIFAMVGARRVHGTVVGNLVREFGNQLRGSPCRAFHEGMKVQIGNDTVLYPDVFVTCDKADLATEHIFKAPSVIVEVLSPGTQGYDRSWKFAQYRRIETLQDFLMIDPDTWRVEGYRRTETGEWMLVDMNDAQVLDVPAFGLRVPFAEVFDGIGPPSDPSKPPRSEAD
jgi:Uma2 family endonuclease